MRFPNADKYREQARGGLASVLGWEREFDVSLVDPDAVGLVDVSVGVPLHGISVLYTSGVAWPAYARGDDQGIELACASTAGELPTAKLLLKFAATLLAKDLQPRVGLFGTDFRAGCGVGDGPARHAFLTPLLFWGDDDRDLFVGDFWVRVLQVTLVTDDELRLFKESGWDRFADAMAERNVDIANWGRGVGTD